MFTYLNTQGNTAQLVCTGSDSEVVDIEFYCILCFRSEKKISLRKHAHAIYIDF